MRSEGALLLFKKQFESRKNPSNHLLTNYRETLFVQNNF